MPFNKAACKASARSPRPKSVAWPGPKNGDSAAMALVMVWWREPPIAQPTQLSSVRAASCRTASGISSKRDEMMNFASLRVTSWEGWAAVIAPPASRNDEPRSLSLMVSLWVRRARRSIHAHAGRLDRSGPFRDLTHDELRQVVRRPALGRDHLDAELLELGLHVGGIHGGDSGILELLDDRSRRALGQENGVPGFDLEVGEALLVGGGQHRQNRRSLLRHDRDRLDQLALDLRHDARDGNALIVDPPWQQ